MGKVCWPAGEALARHCSASDTLQGVDRGVFLEVAAGHGLPSLAVATARRAHFTRVVSTDSCADLVALIRRNAHVNGADVVAHALDLGDVQAARDVAAGDPVSVLAAADIHYDAGHLRNLFAMAAALFADAESPLARRLVIARSVTFDHTDVAMFAAAKAVGMESVHVSSCRAAGILHSASATLFEVNPTDAVDIFEFGAPQGAPADPRATSS